MEESDCALANRTKYYANKSKTAKYLGLITITALALTTTVFLGKDVAQGTKLLKILQSALETQTNTTLCDSNITVDLTGNVFLTKCKVGEEISYDIRKFIRGQPSAIGINLSKFQWIFLLKHGNGQ